ncbi:MAG: FecR domain-containing protein [Chitinophagaceae bacterium]|nr:FecR domain-containing protein [Chitinophagaceae bacterium]
MNRINELFNKAMQGGASEAELKELLELMSDTSREPESRQLIREAMAEGYANGQPMEEDRLLQISEAIMKIASPEVKPEAGSSRSLFSIRSAGWLKWAAIIVLALGAGSYFWLFKQDQGSTGTQQIVSAKDILPGTNKAILTLADGSSIILDSSTNGIIAQQGTAAIEKQSNGTIVYNQQGTSDGKIMTNTLRTPRGGQYKLTLPDGTKVWMNASSSITYPASFTGDTRVVNVTGELYFEVAKNATQPFIVEVEDRSSIEVLGTSFNINAYDNESSSKTTLIEGKVRVKKADQSDILQPGQQARIGDAITIAPKVDIDQILAWKNGNFNFEDMPLSEIMRQLERWYDIEVRYEGPIPAIKFHGKMSRGVVLSDVITFLSDNDLKLKLEDRILIVQ